MYVLGISAYYHDSAACLLKDGEIIAAAQEERFTRKKHDSGFPSSATKYCLKQAGILAEQIESVVFYEKPFVKFERLIETYLAFAPRGFGSFAKAMPLWITDKLFQKSALVKELNNCLGPTVNWRERLLFSEHHLSHAASAYYPSPFESAAVLTMDGVGEWATTSLAIGSGSDLRVVKEIKFPHSIGLLYSAFTYYTGFKVNSGEYKVMGLAPYGKPRYAKLIREKLITVAEDGSFQLDTSYFDYATGLTMTSKKFDALFGGPARAPESVLTQREMDLAASVQQVTEEIVIQLAKGIAEETSERNLCLAGGVALNCVANGVLLREKIFDKVWVQPAAGDAGAAIGAALTGWCLHHRRERKRSTTSDQMKGSYLGPEFTDDEIEAELNACGAIYERRTESQLIEETAKAIADERVVGWVQGRMEFGPRALGARSILADPRPLTMQKQLNLKVKYRESFRPFAPSILREDLRDWFELELDSPYMLFVANIGPDKRLELSDTDKALSGIDQLHLPRSLVPAVTHVDYSARIQTVGEDTNPRFHALLTKFKEKTGCPIVVNTSFNIRGEPIVCSPTDAFKCFMATDMDLLAVGNYLLYKKQQNKFSKQNYGQTIELD